MVVPHLPKPDVVQVELLGRFRVRVGTCRVPGEVWHRRQAAALVKLLALAPGGRLHRDRVIDALWPQDDRDPTNRLHQTAHFARRALSVAAAPAGLRFIMFDGPHLELVRGGRLWVDVTDFELAARQAHAAGDPESYERALVRYHGDLLPEDLDSTWLAARRESLRGQAAGLALDLAALYASRSEIEAAERALTQAVSLDPCDEVARVRLMRYLAAAGRVAQAEWQFRDLSEALRREIGAAPGPGARAAIDAIRSGGPAPTRISPPAVHAAPHPIQPQRSARPAASGRLPAQATRLIGRDAEVDRIARLLTCVRLITLTGAGGVGKTRLAIEVAAGLAAAPAARVWFVELAGLVDASLVAPSLAVAVGAREYPGEDSTAALVRTLGAAPTLVVLDNCEHLVAGCAALADVLLRSCPGTQILATSRETLAVAGEHVVVVPPLSSPDPRTLPPTGPDLVAAVAGTDAVRLLTERITALQPGFQVTADNAADLAVICHRLDGLPLALELVAARTRVLSPRQIAERLGDRFRLLAAGSRTAPSRQQTLRGLIAWSYDLLSIAEQRLFRRLAVFAGWFDLAAAEAVGGGGGLETDLLGLLARLADKSLVQTEVTPAGALYRLLETVRALAAEHLHASGEAPALRARHLAHYLALTERLGGDVGPEPASRLAVIERAYDNIRAALAWCRSPDGEAVAGLRLAAALLWFWEISGRYKEARDWLRAFLERTDDASTPVRAAALYAEGYLAWVQSDYEPARQSLAASAAIGADLGDPRIEGRTLARLALVERDRGEATTGRACAERAVALWRLAGDGEGLSRALHALVLTALSVGADDQADAAGAESVALAQRLDDPMRLANGLYIQALASMACGRWAAAGTEFEAALAIHRQLGFAYMVAQCVNGLGDVARGQRNLARAVACYTEALALWQAMDNRSGVAGVTHNLGHIALLQTAPRLALDQFTLASRLFQDLGDRRGFAECLAGLAGVAESLGQPYLAARLIGATELRLSELGVKLWPSNRAAYQALSGRVLTCLGEAAFARARASPGTLVLESVLADLSALA